MGLRMLRRGMEGPDVRAVQIGLNKVNGGDQDDLEPDGVFGGLTDSAVRRFQEDKRLDVDGIVGPSTRSAFFPLVAVSVNVVGLRTQSDSAPSRLQQRIQDAFSPGRLTLGGMTPANSSGLSLTLPPLFAMPRTLSDEMVSYNGLPDMVPTPRTVASGRGRIEVDWQQIAQTQRQFTGLFRNPQDSFAIGIQSVFKRNNDDGHIEIATGCLLQSPIGISGPGGNDFTIACFANATWVDPLGALGRFHLWSPYFQEQFQGNPTGPANVTNQISLFPINMNVDLNDDGLQLNVNGGAAWNLQFTPNGLVSTWGPSVGLGLIGKFRGF